MNKTAKPNEYVKAHAKSVLVYCKPYDSTIMDKFNILKALLNQKYSHIQVFCEDWVVKECKDLGIKLEGPLHSFKN